MPTIEFNKRTWDGKYSWKNGGDDWSAAWGGPFMQWYGTIFPRIRALVPVEGILEIAPGYGRWTQYLKDLCRHLTVIDLSEKCIAACRQRFAAFPHIEYHVNDGRSLEMIPDGSIDFVFSYDSLVHADESVMEAYLSQLPRILSAKGSCFLHHSNLGAYQARYSTIRRVPMLEKLLKMTGILDKNLHWRDPGVDARKVAGMAEKYRLRCASQEIVHWKTKKALIDCMSTITRNDPSMAAPNRVYRNAYFMQEVGNLLQLSRLYSPETRPAPDPATQPKG